MVPDEQGSIPFGRMSMILNTDSQTAVIGQ